MNDSIFPRDHIVQGNEQFVNDDGSMFGYPGDHIKLGGLTKRELFAAMAMQGLCVNMAEFSNAHAKHIATMARECADALIAELAKAGGPGEGK
jgi:hypothetical protein